MISYQTSQVSKTAGMAVVTTLMVHPAVADVQLLGTDSVSKYTQAHRENFSLTGIGASLTCDPRLVSTESQDNFSESEFMKSVSEFYQGLAGQQESLGTDFESVLFDNLWDLYQN